MADKEKFEALVSKFNQPSEDRYVSNQRPKVTSRVFSENRISKMGEDNSFPKPVNRFKPELPSKPNILPRTSNCANFKKSELSQETNFLTASPSSDSLGSDSLLDDKETREDEDSSRQNVKSNVANLKFALTKKGEQDAQTVSSTNSLTKVPSKEIQKTSRIEEIKKHISSTVEIQLCRSRTNSKELLFSREKLSNDILLSKEKLDSLPSKDCSLSSSHSNKTYRLVTLRPKEEMGKAPAKPPKAPFMTLSSLSQVPSLPQLQLEENLFEDFEEIYDNTLILDRPVSLIPELTEEEEMELEKLNGNNVPPLPSVPLPTSYPEEIEEDIYEPYADTVITNTSSGADQTPEEEENFYQRLEDYEIDFSRDASITGSVHSSFSESYKETKKLQAEKEKKERKEKEKLKKEQKRKEDEVKKIRKKFSMTGDEFVIYDGLVKENCKGGKHDLYVKRGEKVFIIRIENNPTGKWLAKTDEGKVGYVDVTNIEISLGEDIENEEIYDDIEVAEEGTYEET